MSAETIATADFLAGYPAPRTVSDTDLRDAVAGAPRVVWLDDDPTGTQTTKGLPVVTSWDEDDLRWALAQDAPGFFVLTNTRSLSAADAAARMSEIVTACERAADGTRLVYASRGDSTLRGHFPLETDVITRILEQDGPAPTVLLAPAYVDAGRVTIDGTHYVREGDRLRPVASTEFADDATFGYRSSHLPDWVEEKTDGTVRAAQVHTITLGDLRERDDADLVQLINTASTAGDAPAVLVVDAETDDDLRVAAAAVAAAETAGARFVYRVGPSFVRARSAQSTPPPLTDTELEQILPPTGHGLTVVGSHVAQTSRQLDVLLHERHDLQSVELDVPRLLDRPDDHVTELTDQVDAALVDTPVVLHTSRTLVTGHDRDDSLDIARRVSQSLTDIVQRVARHRPPRYVIAKGGITSSDLARHALGIDRAHVAGSLLPGIVSLWIADEGPAAGLPFVVFAGNVGDTDALTHVVARLEARR